MSLWNEMIYFAAFDEEENLLYTKYNFNYDQYALDMGLSTTNKVVIFKDFLNKNGTNYYKPYSVKSEYEKYFFPITPEIITYMTTYGYTIHPNYMNLESPDSYIPEDVLIKQQFDLINYTDSEIQRLQDYFFIESDKGLNYTKYNFQFETYSNDFKVYGSKLLIFTDFVVRCINNSGVYLGFFGYGLPNMYEKYFAPVKGLTDYLIQYCITSVYDVVYKNVNNINWQSYKEKNPDLNPNATVQQLKDHYYLYGQFELREFDYNILPNPINYNILNSVATVSGAGFGNTSNASGFLYSNVLNYTKKYLITCYHVIAPMENKTTIRASFSYQDVNDTLKQPETVIAEFLIIGYDRGTDLVVAVYDPTLDWNVQTKADISKYIPLTIDLNFQSVQKGDLVTFLGNAQNRISEASLSGYVLDDNYSGPFTTQFEVGRPKSYLLNIPGYSGISGGPLFKKRDNGEYGLIGICNSYPADMPNYTQSLDGFLLSLFVNNAIARYGTISTVYANDYNLLQYQLQFPYNQRWLGCVHEYFNTGETRLKYKQFYNFSYMGGVLISAFILGFNPVTRRYVTNYNELSDKNVIPMQTPLLNTEMYKRYLRNGMVPLVIKSISFYDAITASYQEYYYGKYGSQVGLGQFSYGLAAIAILPISDLSLPQTYSNRSYALYQELKINYFYNNGVTWVEDSETIKFTQKDLVSYPNSVGQLFLQNPLELPYFLSPYRRPYFDVKRENDLSKRSDLYWNSESSILGDLSIRTPSYLGETMSMGETMTESMMSESMLSESMLSESMLAESMLSMMSMRKFGYK